MVKGKKKKCRFPESPDKGDRVEQQVKNRLITYEATGETGFGKWKIIKNEPIPPNWNEAVKMEKKAEKSLKKRIKEMKSKSPKIIENEPVVPHFQDNPKKWTHEMDYAFKDTVEQRAKDLQRCGRQTKIVQKRNGDFTLYYKDKPKTELRKKGILAKIKEFFS